MHTANRFALAAALAAGLAASLAVAGLAAAAPASAQAADPLAAVPATTYRPAVGYRPEADPDTPPDHNWVESNATVAAYNSMSLTMKMRDRSAPAGAMPVAPAASAASAASAAPAAGHAAQPAHAAHDNPAGHDMHAGHDATQPAPPPGEAP
jgi:hypothetical protein